MWMSRRTDSSAESRRERHSLKEMLRGLCGGGGYVSPGTAQYGRMEHRNALKSECRQLRRRRGVPSFCMLPEVSRYACGGLKTDQGKREIIVANLPRKVNSFFQSVAQQQNALIKLRNDLVAARAQYQKARSQYLNENLGDYVSVTAGSSGTRVDSEAARRQRFHQSEARVAALEETLAEQEKAFEKRVESAVDQTTVLAMFTGRKFANLEVWDCGTKK